jgi:hypothetical protein
MHSPCLQCRYCKGLAASARVRGEEVSVSLLMLAVVALFPVSLLAILLLTSGLEGKFVNQDDSGHLTTPIPQQRREPRQAGNRSGPGHD